LTADSCLVRNVIGRRSVGSPGIAPWLVVVMGLLAGCESENTPFYDFADNLSRGELRYERSIIDFGTAAARSHLSKGWSIDEEADRQTFVWSEGQSSTLEFFLARPRPLSISFRCAWFGPGKLQELTVYLNGQYVAPVALQPSWQDYHLNLPANGLQAGSNRLRFEYSQTWIPAESDTESTDGRELAVVWDRLHFDNLPNPEPPGLSVSADSGVLKMPLDARLDYYLRIPEGSSLTFDSLRFPRSVGASLTVEIETDEMGARTVGTFRGSQDHQSLAFGNTSPLISRLSFLVTAESGQNTNGSWIELAGLRLMPTTAASRDRDQPGQRYTTSRRPPILIYLIDALRSDHLGCYGYERDTSPNIDRFANDSVLFLRNIAQSSWTKASVASIFTGLTPLLHGAQDRADALPEEAETLAEILRAEGYRTAAFLANGWVTDGFSMTQGFEHRYFVNRERSSRLHDAFSAWLDEQGLHDSFFAYIHSVDPHAPYDPPPTHRQRFTSERIDPHLGSSQSLLELHSAELEPGQKLIQDLLALYDAEIAYNDEHFGELISSLKERGIYDESLIILTSDHGEEFFEHGKLQHGVNLYSEVLNTPLIIKFPKGFGASGIVSSPTQHVDLLPTVLDLLGLVIPPEVEGWSLLPLLERDPPWREVFSDLNLDGNRAESVYAHPWQLIRSDSENGEQGRFELYDHSHRSKDERERERSSQAPIVALYLQKALDRHKENPFRLPAREVAIDEVMERRLKALGYLQ